MSGHITVTPIAQAVTITAGSVRLGRSVNALDLREGSYPAVVYVPRTDIDMGLLERSTRSSSCPWKGAASYYSIKTPDGTLDNAVWSYETPAPAMQAIAGYLAFYSDRVTVTRG